MTDLTTPRLGLPLLAAGQAQKELTHNEALMLIDALIAARAEAANAVTPPLAPLPGQCWALGAAPTGVWQGQAGALAVATAGGWRFCPVRDGFTVSVASGGVQWRRAGTGWTGPAAVAAPAGGSVIDSEARSAIMALKAAMTAAGLVASD